MIEEKSRVPNAVRFILLDNRTGLETSYTTARDLIDFLVRTYPDQQQDPERTGAGWDVAAVQS